MLSLTTSDHFLILTLADILHHNVNWFVSKSCNKTSTSFLSSVYLQKQDISRGDSLKSSKLKQAHITG